MKKKISRGVVALLSATLLVICFAVAGRTQEKVAEAPLISKISGTSEELDGYGSQLSSMKCRNAIYRAAFNFYGVDYEEVSKTSIRETSGVTYEEFLSKMKKLDEIYSLEVFALNAQTFYELAIKGQWNEFLMPSIIAIETNGKFLHGKYNLWNAIETKENLITSKKEHIFRNFESYKESIEALYMVLEKPYYAGSNMNVIGFSDVWAPNTMMYAIALYKKMASIQSL
ncbi:MAG: hypothetical protein HFJ27_06375 [Clostridia bacterium]|nr:hypothetical protein [Clostridia bacterium]